MEIKYYQDTEIISRLDDFFEKLSVAYDLKLPDIKFSGQLAKVLKKHFDWLNFEQLEESFDLNSIGILNEYLPKSGYSIDNKVKFNIPDITKIIKAYSIYKRINKIEQTASNEPTDEQKNKMINDWCDSLCEKFKIYKRTKERLPLRTPLFYANVMVKIGLINQDQVNRKERIINFKNIKYFQSETSNERLVYNIFDELIGNKENINDYLGEFRQSYVNYVFDEQIFNET